MSALLLLWQYISDLMPMNTASTILKGQRTPLHFTSRSSWACFMSKWHFPGAWYCPGCPCPERGLGRDHEKNLHNEIFLDLELELIYIAVNAFVCNFIAHIISLDAIYKVFMCSFVLVQDRYAITIGQMRPAPSHRNVSCQWYYCS